MKKIFICLILFLIISACALPSQERARQALNDKNYTDIEIGDFEWFGCIKDGFYPIDFIATNYTGWRVGGEVCFELFFKNIVIKHQWESSDLSNTAPIAIYDNGAWQLIE